MDLFGEATAAPVLSSSEALGNPSVQPLPEKGEGLAHPRLMNIAIGHENAERKLLDLFNAERMPHALIFSGLKGIGKATIAYRLARFLLKNPPVDPRQDALFAELAGRGEPFQTLEIPFDDSVFRRVSSGGHPDLLTIERAYDPVKNKYKASVAVDEIRKVAPFLHLTSSDGGWRIVIIDDADTMNRSSQNALLKILEEPPGNTLLILVTHRLGALIPTIRSRAHILNFDPLSIDNIIDLLERQSQGQEAQGLAFQQLETLAMLSGGSIGRAVHYKAEGALEMLERLKILFESYPAWHWADIHALSDELSRAGKEQAYKEFCDLLSWVFEELIQSKARGTALNEILEEGSFSNIFTKSSLEALLKIGENLDTHFKKVDTANLDKRQGVLGAFSIISS